MTYAKRLLSLLLALLMLFSLAACNKSDEEEDDSKKEYLEETEIDKLFKDPEEYEGKYVRLTGRVSGDMQEEDNVLAFTVYHDFENEKQEFVVHTAYNKTIYSDGDFVVIEGKIGGLFESENSKGEVLSCLLIEDAKVTVTTYMDIVNPTIMEISSEDYYYKKKNFLVRIDKIQYAETETRIYVTITNLTSYTITYDPSSIYLLVQEVVEEETTTGTGSSTRTTTQKTEEVRVEQVSDTTSSENGGYGTLKGSLEENEDTTGILVFPAMDTDKTFTVVLEGITSSGRYSYPTYEIEIDRS